MGIPSGRAVICLTSNEHKCGEVLRSMYSNYSNFVRFSGCEQARFDPTE